MSRTRWIATLAAAALMLVIPGLSTTAQADPGDLHAGYGYVRDTYNNSDLDGVTVTARTGSASGTIVESAVTDGGLFEFDTLPEGSIYLQFTDPAGRVESRTNGPFRVNYGGYSFGDVELVSNIGLLSGAISQSDGTAPQCSSIEAFRADDPNTIVRSEGASGKHFSFWMPIGTYKLKFRDNCSNENLWLGGTDHASATPRVVTKNATTSVGSFVLPAPLAITGTVRADAGSTALANITVQARSAGTDELQEQVRTRANGAYALTGLTPDSYVLRFTDDEGEFVDEYFNNSTMAEDAEVITLGSSSVTGKNISLAKASVVDQPAVNLKGVVTNFAGKGLSNIEVELFNVGQNAWADSSQYTGRNGTYSFADVEPGTYRVEFEDEGDSDERPTYSDKKITVVVGSSKVTAPPVKLVGDAKVSGRVSLPATSRASRVQGEVSIWDRDDNRVDTASVNGDGTYELNDLTPGSYRVRFEGNRDIGSFDERMISQWWTGKYTLASATVLTVGDSAVRAGVNATLGKSLLATASPRLSGTVKHNKTLRASSGTWNVVAGTTFSYQWYRNGKAISRAVKSSYKLSKADVGKRIQVKVTASNSAQGWTAGAKFSSSTKKVEPIKKAKKKKK